MRILFTCLDVLGCGKGLLVCVLYRFAWGEILEVLGFIVSITVGWMNILLLFVPLPPSEVVFFDLCALSSS